MGFYKIHISSKISGMVVSKTSLTTFSNILILRLTRRWRIMLFCLGEVMSLIHFILLALLWITKNPGGDGGWGSLFPKGYVKESKIIIYCCFCNNHIYFHRKVTGESVYDAISPLNDIRLICSKGLTFILKHAINEWHQIKKLV